MQSRCPPNRLKGDAAAVKLGLGPEERKLKLGPSFTNPRGTSFHTLKYDFKPASVDVNKMASVAVEMNQQVTVTVPHLDGAGTEHTVFKGSQRPYQKECVLIIDRRTGEIMLEKLSSNIQVKKTRKESIKATPGAPGAPGRPSQTGLPSLLDNAPAEPPPASKKLSSGFVAKANSSGSGSGTGGRSSTPSNNHRLKPQQMASSLSGCVPRHSPLRASPSYPSPGHHRSPTGSSGSSVPSGHNRWSPPNQSASLPMLEMDDGLTAMETSVPKESPNYDQEAIRPVGSLSDSSSDSSSESGSSDSDTDEPSSEQLNIPLNGHSNAHAPSPALSVPDHLLNDDLQLSESGSDSD